jgi:hypothetical protein
MERTESWWQRRWVRVIENVLAHLGAVVLGFVMMAVGLGVTMIMLPVGIVVGVVGAAIFVGGLFAKLGEKT